MSNVIKATTTDFEEAACRTFIHHPRSDVVVTVQTSDPKMLVCSNASRIKGAFDYGAGPEAQKLMAEFISEAEKNNHHLALTLQIH